MNNLFLFKNMILYKKKKHAFKNKKRGGSMSKIVVIGAGASGIVSAIYGASLGNEVILLERNDKPLKKLLITGNGRCNYFNEDFNISHFYSSDMDCLSKIITDENKKEILSFFDKIGIYPKIKDGCYYPFSNKATSVKESLLMEAKIRNVTILTNSYVKDVIKEENKFIVYLEEKEIVCDKVIISCGSKAYPKTGSDGNGYNLVKGLGHSINEVYPALVQLECRDYSKELSGIRTFASISYYDDGVFVTKEEGELQFTDYGISGICVFNISGLISKGLISKKEQLVRINLLPFLKDFKEAYDFIEKRNEKLKGRNIVNLLEGILDYRIVLGVLKRCRIAKTAYFSDLDKKEKERLVSVLTSLTFVITKTKSYESAQVCGGGVPLSEINLDTMESLKTKGLYLTGEILDVYGKCGGYNLGFAFITGMLGGRNND